MFFDMFWVAELSPGLIERSDAALHELHHRRRLGDEEAALHKLDILNCDSNHIHDSKI